MPNLHLLTILLLAFTSNLDNVGVGISYGIRKINIPFASNLLIALVTSAGTLVSVLLGESIYLFISAERTALLGGSIIVAAGIWVLFQEQIMQRGREPREEQQLVAEAGLPRFGFRQIVSILDNPIIADWDFSGHIDLKEAIALALGLTINNIPNGVGAGMVGCGALLMTVAVFLFSILTIWVGISGGLLGYKWLGRLTGVLSGLILIGVGLYEIFF